MWLDRKVMSGDYSKDAQKLTSRHGKDSPGQYRER